MVSLERMSMSLGHFFQTITGASCTRNVYNKFNDHCENMNAINCVVTSLYNTPKNFYSQDSCQWFLVAMNGEKRIK